jgi:uncharacterized Zn ribbon protein
MGEKHIAATRPSPLHVVSAIGHWVRNRLTGPKPVVAPLPPRAYDVRKQRLPNLFTSQDWDRALEYWGYKCAICERPRGLWHTLAQDHWIPLTSPACPGTVASNILPLCHGEGGCNNSKGKKLPLAWLETHLGKRRASRKLEEIEAYFVWAHEHASLRPGCPRCGAPITFYEEHDLWQCPSCGAEWNSATAGTLAHCPTCQCWMAGSRGKFHCPRCQVEWAEADLPIARCPRCRKGILQFVDDDDEGWWLCAACGSEWVDS